MRRFEHDEDATRCESLVEDVGDLFAQTLLHLRAGRDRVDDLRQGTEPDDAFVGEVGDVRRAEERQQMVLAHGTEGDVADEHGVARRALLDGDRASQVLAGVLADAAEELRVRVGDARRGVGQAVAGRILADRVEDLQDGRSDSRSVHGRPRGRVCIRLGLRGSDRGVRGVLAGRHAG